MARAALLALVVTLAAGCSSAQRLLAPQLPRIEQLQDAGVTPRGVTWHAEGPLLTAGLEEEIDAEATDTTWDVVVVGRPFRAGPEHGLPEDLYDGLADPRERVVYVIGGARRRELLRHEYHHVALFSARGSVDPGHTDPSWRTLP